MTSSSDLNEKSMVDQNMQQEEEILSPMPLAFYDPNWMNKNRHQEDLIPLQLAFHLYQIQQEQFNNGGSERLKSSMKLGEEIGYFSLNAKDAQEFTKRDETFRACWYSVDERENRFQVYHQSAASSSC